MAKIYKRDVSDKAKYIMQTLNEKWDRGDKINNIGILLVAAILSLVLMSKFSILFIVILLGVQRLLYHIKFFTDESPIPDTVDEDSKS
jgi:hypothetical protein